MKKTVPTPKFHHREWDHVLLKLLNQSLSSKEKKEIEGALSTSAGFREYFADWIKGLRDPGWQQQFSKNVPRKANFK